MCRRCWILSGARGRCFPMAWLLWALWNKVAPLSGYDGMLQDPIMHWQRVCEKGFSPTALETHARCPFQYFAAQVLDLTSVGQEPSMELPPPAMGYLCHEALRRCYQALIAQGLAPTGFRQGRSRPL